MRQLFAILLLALTFVVSCGASVEPALVAGIADVANAGADPLLAAYKLAGDDAIASTRHSPNVSS